MGSYRSVYFDVINRIHGEIADADTLLVGNISPSVGPLSLTTPLGQNLNIGTGGGGAIVNIISPVLLTGLDLGTPVSRAGTIYATTINANNIVGELDSNGTNSDVWQVNEDNTGASNEPSGTVWLASDGADILSWRHRIDTNGILNIEYKVNPTDPSNLSEVWTNWVQLNNDTAEMRLELDLAFPNGGAIVTTNNGNLNITPHGSGSFRIGSDATILNFNVAGAIPDRSAIVWLASDGGGNISAWRSMVIGPTSNLNFQYKINPVDPTDLSEIYSNVLHLDTTSGNVNIENDLILLQGGTINTTLNNDLNISAGLGNVNFSCTEVDIRTNVTSLDIPSGVGLKIGGIALTTLNWTAPNVDILLNSSNADTLHYHSGTNQLRINGLTTIAMAQYQAGYISADNTITPTDCSAATGTFKSATFAGVYNAVVGEIVKDGKIIVRFDAALVPAPTAGEPAILSWINPGQFRNDTPAKHSNNFQTKAGIILDASTYGINQRCTILIDPDVPLKV